MGVATTIKPGLNPESHRTFYKEDYPRDDQHVAPEPPSLQDSDKYDRDYVKDENNDREDWKQEAEYERLKAKLARAKAAAKRAQQKEENTKKVVEVVKEEEEVVKKTKVEKSEKNEEKKHAAEAAAETKVREAEANYEKAM